MSLQEAFNSKKFVVTAEISPPCGTEVEPLLEKTTVLSGIVDAVNVTSNQRAQLHLSTLAFCRLLKERGFDPIYQITCRDRNALALNSDLLGAYALGIRNVLALSGDYPDKESGIKPVYDLDSVQLIKLIKKMEQKGLGINDKPLKGKTNFLLGAALNAGAEPLHPQIIKAKKKIEAGAQFFQTQVIYDVDIFKKFLKEFNEPKVVILAGILPLKSSKMARFLNDNVPGINVPDRLIKRLEDAKDQTLEGINISIEIISELRPLCKGVHLMTLNNLEIVPQIIKQAQLE